MTEPKDAIDETEIRRLEGDARERMGLPRDRPVESFLTSGRVSVASGALTRVRGAQAPGPMSDGERAARQKKHRMARVGWVVPEKYAGLTLGSPQLAGRVKLRLAVEQARQSLDAPGVTFLGPTSAGKTTLACAAMADWIMAKGGTPYFVPCRKLAAARAAHSLGEGEPDIVERALAADLLILDDLGVGDDVHRSAVGDVIDERYDRMRVTWVTTGFEATDISAKYGAGRARRVFEDPVVVIRCGALRK